jgi:hypothetical protein
MPINSVDIESIVSGTSQFNSNTDEGLRLLIRSQPTPIGCYVFANRHLLDRAQALQKTLWSLERQRIKREEISQEIDRLERGLCGISAWFESDSARALRAQEVRRRQIDLEELESEMAVTAALIRDCERECKVCREEIQLAEEASGIRFRELSEDGFQLHMRTETHRRYVRRVAAIHLSRTVGIPLEVATMFFELPSAHRADFFRAYQAEMADIDLFLGDLSRGNSAFGNLPVGAERFDHLATGSDS